MNAPFARLALLLPVVLYFQAPDASAQDDKTALARKAQEILKTSCYRCHGEDGAVEGGFNYALDFKQLVAKKKVVPGKPDESRLLKRVVKGDMPPEEEKPRPSEQDIATLKDWIAAGVPDYQPAITERPFVPADAILKTIHDDLQKLDASGRRFARYFTLTHLYNAKLSEDELQTYRHALAKLVNSLSWGKDIVVPKPIDELKTIYRIDLRDYQWNPKVWDLVIDANPYGVTYQTEMARFCYTATGCRLPYVRGDWFVYAAARPPLYHDILQLPRTDRDLERMLHLDVDQNIRQQQVIRAGFNGSGVSRNNRMIERHVSPFGAYWKSYDFASNTGRQNLFAHPLGPGVGSTRFQHDGGEIIFNLPNGLQAYLLVDAKGQRIDKGPTAIVSDPKRPDRAVENGISCMSCHAKGMIEKADQIRDHVDMNPKGFFKAELPVIQALYPPKEKLFEAYREDAERFRKAVEATGGHLGTTEPVAALAVRFENELDLTLAAAEVGLPTDAFLLGVQKNALLQRILGNLKVEGGTVQRTTFNEAFARAIGELQIGDFLAIQGELRRFNGHGDGVTSVALSGGGRFLVSGCRDKTVRVFDIIANKELRRFDGHTHEVKCVAMTRDRRFVLSGGYDKTLRLWDVEKGVELRRFTGHTDVIMSVAFSADGTRALSGSWDDTVRLWDVTTGKELYVFKGHKGDVMHVALSADGKKALSAGADKIVRLWDAASGKEIKSFSGHSDTVLCVALSADGKRLLSASLDGTVRLWNAENGKEVRPFDGAGGLVTSVCFSPDGKRAISNVQDQPSSKTIPAVVLWDVETGKELRRFEGHRSQVTAVAFSYDGTKAISGSLDKTLRMWGLPR
jgi:mono/diheme cytochrome c family protein